MHKINLGIQGWTYIRMSPKRRAMVPGDILDTNNHIESATRSRILTTSRESYRFFSHYKFFPVKEDQ